MMRVSIAMVVCLLCMQTACTAVVVDIEGKILVSALVEEAGPYAYVLQDTTSGIAPAPSAFVSGDMSPYMNRVAYAVTSAWPPLTGHVWTAQVDGSEPFQVTTAQSVGGVNCRPAWSPDASQIAFQHSDPTAELIPCEAGFSVWVIDADGRNPRRLTPEHGVNPRWAPNGYRVICRTNDGAVTVDSDGTNLQVLPNVADFPDWSPDGTQIASCTYRPDTVDGQPGVWRELLLTDADGGNPRVLVARFVRDDEVSAHLARDWPNLTPDQLVMQRVRVQVGPSRPEWSPAGDRLLFYAALPFDPDGLWCAYQAEIHVYDLGDDTVVPITDNQALEFEYSWDGDNTFPADPLVEVDNLALTFDTVLAEGVTTIIRDDDPPQFDTGFQFGYEFYEVSTTATTTGPVTVCFSYTDALVPSGPAEADLAILHWDEGAADWLDITVSRDAERNVICGESPTLSPFAVHGSRRTRFPDVPAWGFGADGMDAHWAYMAVEECVRAGIVRGYPDGLYRPTARVRRDAMAVFVGRSMGAIPAGPEEATFPDVPLSHWAYDAVEYVAAAKVAAGYPNGYYRPGYEVDRGQMAVFIARAKGWVDIADDMATAPTLFLDVPEGYWAGTAIEACVDSGVVQGYGDGLYRPAQAVTRDQMAVYVARAW